MNDRSRQLVLDLPLRQAMGREDFLVTDSNAAAVALIDQWPNWPSYGAIILGPPGCGKSHLVQVWRQKTGALLCQASLLNIEDVPIILQQDKTLAVEVTDYFDERAFFHLLNFAKQHECQLLITAQNMPNLWNIKTPDLLSRLNALPAISILPPDDALLRGVLVKLFADRQINVDEATISYMILRMPRSLQSARDIVAEIDRQAMTEKAEITRPFVAKVLSGLSNPDFFDDEN
jgi:chromosomal replication initiation ATPase DnaA